MFDFCELKSYVVCTYMLIKLLIIHYKSESRDPNGAAKKFELSANLSKNATKWPKMAKNDQNMTQSDQNMTQNDPRMTRNGPKITRTFSAIFF